MAGRAPPGPGSAVGSCRTWMLEVSREEPRAAGVWGCTQLRASLLADPRKSGFGPTSFVFHGTAVLTSGLERLELCPGAQIRAQISVGAAGPVPRSLLKS